MLLTANQNSVPFPVQIHEKEEEEFNEKSEQDSGINEEPLLTAEQVPVSLAVPVSFYSFDRDNI